MKLHRTLAKAAGYEMTKYSKHPSSKQYNFITSGTLPDKPEKRFVCG
ncbi:hypothetical protein [Desulfosarcina sp. BuS5]|nr:hypothetical protein [Desulfosarcina sp. BuS5]